MSDSKSDSQFMTVLELATLLKVNKYTVYRWIKSGKIASVKFGGSVRIDRSKLNLEGKTC